MTEHSNSKPKTKHFWERIQNAIAAYPEAAAIAVYAAIAIAAVLAAYFSIFTVLQPYDDEGTLLTTVQAFVHGETLYRDIYSSYGPFYYEVFGGLFSLSGSAITTDASRTIVIVLWVGTSLLFGLAAQSLTRRLFLGATCMVVAFAALGVLINEPMHPQGLAALLFGVFVVLVVWDPARRSGWFAAAAGAVLAALLMTKVNLGIYALAAVVLAAVWTSGPLYRRAWLRWAVTAAFLAMPVFIAARDLDLSWVRELVVLEFLCAIAILVAALPLRPRPGEEEARLMRWLLTALAGFLGAFAAILGIILLTGPSPADVYEGVVTLALRVRDALILQFQLPAVALDWGIAAIAIAMLLGRLRHDAATKPRIWPGLLRAVASLSILFNIAHIAPLGLDPAGGSTDVMPMVLAWVAAIPPVGVRESAQKRFVRLLLPALAIAETLQVYPVAGSQTGIAALLFVPVAAVCLGDALTELRAWAVARGGATVDGFGLVASVSTAALAAMFVLSSILMPAVSNVELYREQQKLELPGATLLRLPQSSVETYEGIVAQLHQHHCSTFVGYPSVSSLYLWSGLEAPAPQLPNAWLSAFDRDQQQRVVDELRASPKPCAIINEELASFYLASGPPEDLPLVHYVFNDFTKVATVGEFQLLVPKGDAGQ